MSNVFLVDACQCSGGFSQFVVAAGQLGQGGAQDVARAASATATFAGYAQLLAQVAHHGGALVNGLAHLAVGYGMAYTDVHGCTPVQTHPLRAAYNENLSQLSYKR